MDIAQAALRSERIAQLNDKLRREGEGGRMFVTSGVRSLAAYDARQLVLAVAAYDHFGNDNDPYGERDFGAFEEFGAKLYWKIDYYDLALMCGSPDPADAGVTCRVLTVLLPSEY